MTPTTEKREREKRPNIMDAPATGQVIHSFTLGISNSGSIVFRRKATRNQKAKVKGTRHA